MNLPAMSTNDVDVARFIEKKIMPFGFKDIVTYHTLHGGVYTRTVVLNAGDVITGALIKIKTTLIITGNIDIYIGNKVVNVDGFSSIVAEANRKQVMYARDKTSVTMLFKTKAKTIEEAEDEFTDESDMLLSRSSSSINIINGGM